MKETQISSFESQKKYLMDNIPAELKRYITGNIRNGRPLLEDQQQVMHEYYIFLVTEKSSVAKYRSYLNNIAYMYRFASWIGKPFNQITKDDIKAYFFSLHNRNVKESTINQYRITFRTFFKFLYGTKDYPEVVSWMEFSRDKKTHYSPDQLLSKIEIRKMIDACALPRDKALVAILYESAARRGELLACNIKHVLPDKFGMRIKLPESKTKPRTVRLIDSCPFAQLWLNNHPDKDNLEAPLFPSLCKFYGNRMSAECMKTILRRAAKAAGITKKVNPHAFRHARLDALAREGFNERDLKLIAGWSDGSDMPGVYLHYGMKELDEKLLLKSGRIDKEQEEKEKQEKEALKPKDCPRCRIENPAGSKYCHSCGMALNLKDYMDDQEVLKNETDERLKVYAGIMSDPEKRAKFEEFKKMFFS